MSGQGALVEQYDEIKASPQTWAHSHTSHPLTRLRNYFISLFPIARWIYRYNLTWLYGDLIAGITVGIVVVPQGMSYAKIATLSPEYGLYSSFVGVFIYCFFATSKDVSIGPVAVMSLQVGRTILKVAKEYPQYADSGPIIGLTLSLLCGGIAAGLGLLRLGFILEFIPIPAVMGFMTGSAFSILVGQLPGLLGTSKLLDTRASTYLVMINFLKQLKHANIDAAFGIISLFVLFVFKYFSSWGEKRFPRYRVPFFYVGVLRNAFVIVLATLISWAVYRHQAKPAASLIKTVPSGFKHVGVPTINHEIVSALVSELPVSVIVLLLEHISISKSFGRINDYKIVPDQELIAIGVTNLIGVFFTAYPATGSFSRSALKAKCGVRTPLAGIFTGAVVILALYALTDAFYWIPNATLSAIIIHAVYDLMANYKVTWNLWKVSPLETVIFLAAVIITVFVTIEAGIYFSICASAAFLLLRIAKAKGDFLGRVEYFEVVNPTILNTNPAAPAEGAAAGTSAASDAGSDSAPAQVVTQESNSSVNSYDLKKSAVDTTREVPAYNPQTVVRKFKWVPLSARNLNPKLKILPPPTGVIVFRPNESFTYPNCSRQVDFLFDEVKRVTRRGIANKHIKLGDRPWNDHGPRNRTHVEEDYRPLLRAIILDFSAVPYIDSTGVQNLVDIRNAINRYANTDIEFHFVGILSHWSRRALLAEGFGTGTPSKTIIGVSTAYFTTSESQDFSPVTNATKAEISQAIEDEETNPQHLQQNQQNQQNQPLIPLLSTETPFFHSEIPDLE